MVISMKELMELLQTYGATSVLILFILFIMSVFGIMETIKRVKSYLESYHEAKTKEEGNDRTIKERLEKLEKDEERDKEKLDQICNSIRELKIIIEKVQDNQNKSNIAICRSSMYRLASELINKQWMSQIESDTLEDLLNVYISSGNVNTPSVVKRAMVLPVLTDEEIRLKKEKREIKEK